MTAEPLWNRLGEWFATLCGVLAVLDQRGI